ncbi:helix-turn-helix transcriptional regulator [uncultured Olegusella sp.]|uniref:helix-turn-helix domain-containing protein n=1 Tax=uncultured Olegusella sp. TaxID=1979846 RepID=UPI00261BE7E1|nr:helix-turn-helix transcriptional regulator [uncultured Olegusella sp.]
MARPRFSEILYRRRRELGISTAQASRVLRLKEQVIIAFEEGCWDDMPKSGYAQGMLASYANYLGLDAQRLTRQFASDLADYQSGGDHQSRRRGLGDGARMPVETRRSRTEHENSGARGLLPTSGGYAGDLAGFSTVSPVHSRSYEQPYSGGYGTYDNQSRDVRGRLQDGEKRYTMLAPDTAEPRRAARAQAQRARGRDQLRVDGYGDSSRDNRLAVARPQRQRSAYRPRVPIQTENHAAPTALPRPERDYVTRRRVEPSDYVDDLRYNDQANPYQMASAGAGRAGARRIVDAQRPNVRRQQRRTSSQNPNRRNRRPQQPQGLLGMISSIFSDNIKLIVIILLVLAVILFMLIISSVTSCTSNMASNGRSNTVAVSTTKTKKTDENDPATQATQSNTDTGSDLNVPEVAKTQKSETKVEVTVAIADGGVSWVEVTVDGESKEADTLTGPWSATYNVTKAMQVEVSDPTAVTVTRNGKVQSFDQKASGVGSITIDGPAANDENATKDGGKNSSSKDGNSTSQGGMSFDEQSTSDTDQQ